MPIEDADDEFYRRAAAALERAGEAAEQQVHATDNLAHEINLALESIDEILPSLPTRAEVDARRRQATVRVLFAALWLVVGSMFVSDEHVEHCSPGARAQRVVRRILDADVSLDRLRSEARRDLPAWCDVMIPAHSHDPLGDWPSPENVAGLGVYAVLGVITTAAVWPRRPKENHS